MATPAGIQFSEIKGELAETVKLEEIESQELARIFALYRQVDSLIEELNVKPAALSIGTIQTIVTQMQYILEEERTEESLIGRINEINSNLQFRIGRMYQANQAKESIRRAAARLKFNTARIIDGIYRDIGKKHKMLAELSVEISNFSQAFENFLKLREENPIEAQKYGLNVTMHLDRMKQKLKNLEGWIKNIQARIKRLKRVEIKEEHIIAGRVPIL